MPALFGVASDARDEYGSADRLLAARLLLFAGQRALSLSLSVLLVTRSASQQLPSASDDPPAASSHRATPAVILSDALTSMEPPIQLDCRADK